VGQRVSESEQIINGYTVPLTLVYTGKYRQKTLKPDTTKTKQNPEKANNKIQQNRTSLV